MIPKKLEDQNVNKMNMKLSDFNHPSWQINLPPPAPPPPKKKNGEDSPYHRGQASIRLADANREKSDQDEGFLERRVGVSKGPGGKSKAAKLDTSFVVRLGIFGIFVAGTHICNVVQVQHFEHVSFLKDWTTNWQHIPNWFLRGSLRFCNHFSRAIRLFSKIQQMLDFFSILIHLLRSKDPLFP